MYISGPSSHWLDVDYYVSTIHGAVLTDISFKIQFVLITLPKTYSMSIADQIGLAYFPYFKKKC